MNFIKQKEDIKIDNYKFEDICQKLLKSLVSFQQRLKIKTMILILLYEKKNMARKLDL